MSIKRNYISLVTGNVTNDENVPVTNIMNELHVDTKNKYKLIKPSSILIDINTHTINNLIKFTWIACKVRHSDKQYIRCKYSYDNSYLFYKFHPRIEIIKYIQNDELEEFLTLDSHTDFDYGLWKKAILVASLNNDYLILDALLTKKLDVNRIYFDNMSLLEYATLLFKKIDNFYVIMQLISCGANVNKPFRDGSLFYQNFITAITRISIPLITAHDRKAFQLYKDEKMDEFYDLYFDYGMNNINIDVYLKYSTSLKGINIDTTFKNIQYLFPEQKYKKFQESINEKINL